MRLDSAQPRRNKKGNKPECGDHIGETVKVKVAHPKDHPGGDVTHKGQVLKYTTKIKIIQNKEFI